MTQNRDEFELTVQEKKQKLMLCVSTLLRVKGRMPKPLELYQALGHEYTNVLAEYLLESKGHLPSSA